MLTNRERLILLNLVADVGSTRLRKLLDTFETLERLFKATANEIQQVERIGPVAAERIATGCRNERALAQELARAKARGVTVVTLEDAEYPQQLKTIHDPPLVLYVQGTLTAEDTVSVAIVGTRRASFYGLRSAEQLGYDLALRGITVVSGLALGVDGAAHRGAVKAKGRTLAILGSGLDHLYPPAHQELAQEIAQHGALISEFPMATTPEPYHFPRRNRIISGLSLGVVVVEAAQRSGALITADFALEQGREVFAVPGPMEAITSQGTHQLLKQGARLVTSVEDILEELHVSGRVLPLRCSRSWAPPPGVDPPTARIISAAPAQLLEQEQRVFACVSEEQPRYIDVIAAESEVTVSEASVLLLQLELKHLVQQLPGKQFVRKPLHPPPQETPALAGEECDSAASARCRPVDRSRMAPTGLPEGLHQVGS